jgi:DNA-binding LacI/PurR family transcriptional regulator
MLLVYILIIQLTIGIVFMNGRLFKYEEIAEDLRCRLSAGKFSNGRLPSERELADYYSVNRMTLRKAVGLLEREKLVYRDRTRGTYAGPGKKLNRGNRIIALVLFGRSRKDRIHSATVMELERQARRYGGNIMLFSAENTEEAMDVLGPPARSGLIDGIILTGLVSPDSASRIKEIGVPVVLFGHLLYSSPTEGLFDRVVPDSVEYSFTAVKSAIRNGACRVALLNGPGYQWLLNVYQGYMRALVESGIEYDESLVFKCDSEFLSPEDSIIQKLYEARPDAVFIGTERLACSFVRSLRRSGGSVPEGISLFAVGTEFSDFEDFPGLNYVKISWEDMAGKALEMLFSRFAEPKLPPRSANVEFEMVMSAR